MNINSLWPLICLLALAITSSAQNEQPPKEEYKLLATASTISVARGQQDSIKISVLRSKSFKTGSASVVLNPPVAAGLSVTMKQLSDCPDEFMVYVSATAEVKSGEYMFIPTCTLRNKSKGIIMKLIIK